MIACLSFLALAHGSHFDEAMFLLVCVCVRACVLSCQADFIITLCYGTLESFGTDWNSLCECFEEDDTMSHTVLPRLPEMQNTSFDIFRRKSSCAGAKMEVGSPPHPRPQGTFKMVSKLS